VREDPVLAAGQEHDGELQALCGVQRHQRDLTARLTLRIVGVRRVGQLIGVGHQRHPLEEAGDRPVRVGLLVLAGDGHELTEVLDPALVLRIGGDLELVQVPGLLEDRLQHGRRAGACLDQRGERVHQVVERLHLGQRPGRDAVRLLAPAQRGREGDPLP
jgi:hypothetical protein